MQKAARAALRRCSDSGGVGAGRQESGWDGEAADVRGKKETEEAQLIEAETAAGQRNRHGSWDIGALSSLEDKGEDVRRKRRRGDGIEAKRARFGVWALWWEVGA